MDTGTLAEVPEDEREDVDGGDGSYAKPESAGEAAALTAAVLRAYALPGEPLEEPLG